MTYNAALAEERNAARLLFRDTSNAFQDAKENLAICKAATDQPDNKNVMAAHKRWSDAAGAYSTALSDYSQLLIVDR